MKNRIEHDMLGRLEIPAGRYYGIHTARAARNFQTSGRHTAPELIKALALVKKACCATNTELGYLDAERGGAIFSACDDILEGKLDGEFITDALQGGAGTSANMNVNEVIANRALELLGREKGDYEYLHPLDHVNLHQSTNDVYPTALKVAAIFRLRALSEKLAAVQEAFQQKEPEFAELVKIGRTELQDAVPMTLGAEFSAFAEAFARDRWRTFKAEERLRIVNIGGTAIGTGIAAPRSYIFTVIEKLREFSLLGLSRGENCVDQTANQDAFVEASATMKACAVNFQKVARDLRLLHSLGEIHLAPRQAGSSIMPGKVNPVLMESIIQGAIVVRSCDATVAECAAAGTLQINEFLPLLADSLLTGLRLLENLCGMMLDALSDLKPDKWACLRHFESCPLVITAFIPYIGYEKSLALLEEFHTCPAGTLREFLKKKLDPALVDKVLNPQNLIALGYRD
ncbi:MAG: aspartate ammonia-lyase [Victivallaceae bacterium]|nr:aspartate ammonia-lyase [Victivallaceae bacterium]